MYDYHRVTTVVSTVALLLSFSVAIMSQEQQPLQSFERTSPGPQKKLRAMLSFDGEKFLARSQDYTLIENKRPGQRSALLGLPGMLKASVLCIDATTSNGFFFLPPLGNEAVDWASKTCGGTGAVARFAIGYATAALDASESGGVGGTIGLSLYEGTSGFCSKGSLAQSLNGNEARFTFFGLPGATGTQVAPHFLVTAFLPDNDPLCLPDGKIGWGYTALDTQTGPILIQYASNTCWFDSIDLWARPDEFGSCVGTFFGACAIPTIPHVGPPCAGFYIQLWESECAGPGSQTPHTVSPNTFALAPGTGPDLGLEFSMTQTPLSGSSILFATLHGGDSFLSAGISPGFLSGGTRIHTVFGPKYLDFGPVFTAGTPSVWKFLFPKSPTLCGVSLVSQGFDITVGPFTIAAVNAVLMTVGS